jgi:hypothetical protein
MKFSEIVILGGTEASRSEVSVKAKDPYFLFGIRLDFICGEA